MRIPINTGSVDNEFCDIFKVQKGSKFTYAKGTSYDLVGKSDADWSGDVNDGKSMTGYYLKLLPQFNLLHSGQDKKWDNVVSFRSYGQNGS